MCSATPRAAESPSLEALLEGIDRGLEAHLAWNQRLLRCALLRESPGDDMLAPGAHTRCEFGRWLTRHQQALETVDADLVRLIVQAHQRMHDAVRHVCEQVLQGTAASAIDMQAYEEGQSTMVTMLNRLRERASAAASHLDALTGVPLRHGLEYTFNQRSKEALSTGMALWVAMIDADHFKAVNDVHGHAAGDAALQHIAMRLAACLRDTDTLFRFGGEEFLALFLVPETQAAEQLARRLLHAVSDTPLSTTSGALLELSVTVGLAEVGPGEDLASATERADRAMLQGKAQGRNRYVMAPGSAHPQALPQA